MANLVFIAMSIDGYIATKDGDISWLESISNPDKSDFGYARFMERIDAIVMGRQTFEKVMSFDVWPYTKKVFVLSSTLNAVPQKLLGKVEIINKRPIELVKHLSDLGMSDLYIDGGKTIQSFLKLELIDEMIISTIPIVLGEGIPLFAKQDHAIQFKHIETTAFNGGLVQTCYRKIS